MLMSEQYIKISQFRTYMYVVGTFEMRSFVNVAFKNEADLYMNII